MSEYQYYEFLAIDRPLGEGDQEALRELSTRAEISATRFVNFYEWGDFKGDPARLMERWFDLHLYLANWGTRRLMIRLPARFVDLSALDPFLGDSSCVTVRRFDQNLIFDITRGEVEPDDVGDDGSGWLARLAPVRADILAGDLRFFYLLWLMAVEEDALAPDAKEPISGIGPLTRPLEAVAGFFHLDPDLVAAAAERSATAGVAASPEDERRIIASMTEDEKTGMLVRLLEGDPHLRAGLRRLVRDRLMPEPDMPPATLCTVGELRFRAREIRHAREREAAERREVARRRQAEEEKEALRARLDALARRGDGVWREIETEIERRNAAGYDRAADLLFHLALVAQERGTKPDFDRRLHAIRERHARKGRFMERLAGIGAGTASGVVKR